MGDDDAPVSSGPAGGPEEPRPRWGARGPFLRLLRRLRLARADGTPRARVLVLIAWVPLALAALLDLAAGVRPPPMFRDLSVHVRLLIGIPLLIEAERQLELRCRVAIAQLQDGNFADRPVVDGILERAERLRDARLTELALAVLVIVAGEAMLWGLLAPTGLFAGFSAPGGPSFMRVWYAVVGWSIAQFLLLRWLWHWATWSYALARLSRLPLATIATHPDHAAGIGFVREPIAGFAVFVLATAATMAAAWGTQILAGRATLQDFGPSFVGFLVLAIAIACGPMLLFAGLLFRARRREIASYNELALEYVRAFHAKWIEPRSEGEAVLGTPDLQSLNDLLGSYESLVQARLVPFGPRELVVIAIAAAIPMLPLVLTAVPLHELIRRVGGALIGGLPG